MVAQTELTRLLERKRALLAESELIRADISESCADILEFTDRWSTRVERLRGPGILALAGALAAGLLIARKSGRSMNLVAKLAAGWRVLSSLRGVWRGWQASRRARS